MDVERFDFRKLTLLIIFRISSIQIRYITQSSIPELTIQREYNMFEFNLKFNHIEIKYPTFISFANLYTQGKNYFINNIITIL